jgi:hypothetical protein
MGVGRRELVQRGANRAEVGKLLNNVRLLATSAGKVTHRAARIDAMEFSEEADKVETQPSLRLATGGE